MKFRTIYMLECYDSHYDCVIRNFFRNKRAAYRAASRASSHYREFYIAVSLVPKCAHCYIRPEDVLA